MERQQKDEAFEALLRYLRASRGFDFTGYKRTSLMRRVRHRMEQAGYTTFNTILITVTDFFREPEVGVDPRRGRPDGVGRARARRPDPGVERRVCLRAGGLHACDAADRALGTDAFRQRVKIYATDVDEHALSQARAASYDNKAVESIPQDLRTRYFEQVNGRYVFRQDLRRMVIFGRNDLVKDAPISRRRQRWS